MYPKRLLIITSHLVEMQKDRKASSITLVKIQKNLELVIARQEELKKILKTGSTDLYSRVEAEYVVSMVDWWRNNLRRAQAYHATVLSRLITETKEYIKEREEWERVTSCATLHNGIRKDS